MRRWTSGGLAVLGGVAVVAAVASMVGSAWWRRDTARMVDRLGAASRSGTGAQPYAPEQLAGLPEPVQRYFAFALAAGQPPIRRARLRQQGEFSTRPGAWRPFTAAQHVATEPPGLVWDATIEMTPGLPMRVRDSYLGGEGRMHGKAAGLVTVVDQRGTPAMAIATLQRYLAEAPWVPTALLPSAGVRWTTLDDRSARATITDRDAAGRDVTASVDFRFGERGEISEMSAERFRDVDGTPVPTAWAGRYWGYERTAGVMVPLEGEIAWVLPSGRFPYWRARLSDFEYDHAR
jgi:hypothetical protein